MPAIANECQCVMEENDNNEPATMPKDTNDSPSCPICLSLFENNQLISTPDSCKHMFCVECLQEWSKVSVKLLSFLLFCFHIEK